MVGTTEHGHDIVVIGASAGGVEALRNLAPTLDSDLNAAVFVVLHLSPESHSALPHIISRAGRLPAEHPYDGMPIERGRIYVAPPDHHMVIENGTVGLNRGPRENGYRPAIDRLFTTAAAAYGPRVTGVILSGALDDGTAGLSDVVRAGGAAVVQDPDSALYPSMPASAAAAVPDADVLHIDAIGHRICELTNGVDPTEPASVEVEEEEDMSLEQAPNPESLRHALVGLTCPDCSGALSELEEGGVLRYRCRVGHAYSVESLLAEQGASLERALWSALRALEERIAFLIRLSRRMAGSPRVAQRYEREAEEVREQAKLVRAALDAFSPIAESA